MTAKLDLAQFQGFTPGPWHRNIKPATKYTTIWSGRNTHVMYVAVNGLPPAEVEANIALGAAAPAILAYARELDDYSAKVTAELANLTIDLNAQTARVRALDARNAKLAAALQIISAWDPGAAPHEPDGMSIMDAIDIADAALAEHDKAEG